MKCPNDELTGEASERKQFVIYFLAAAETRIPAIKVNKLYITSDI